MRLFAVAVGFFVLILPGCASSRHGSAITLPEGHPFGPAASSIRTIVIDAGHGGDDPGASYFGVKEKELALDIALRVRGLLAQQGFTVYMTRDTDDFVALSKRAAYGNRHSADLFVSIHLNANTRPWVAGVEVYFPSESVVLGEAQWPPDVKASEVSIPSTTIRQLLWDVSLRQSRAKSVELAAQICEAFRAGLKAECAVLPARFVVLRESWMPSVLVEVGYLSNKEENTRLSTSAYRQKAAESIAEGLLSYIRKQGEFTRKQGETS